MAPGIIENARRSVYNTFSTFDVIKKEKREMATNSKVLIAIIKLDSFRGIFCAKGVRKGSISNT